MSGGDAEKVRLIKKQDRTYAVFTDGDEEIPVKIVWARPVSAKGHEVSLVGEDKKELMMLQSLDCLDEESRKIAENELEQRYLVPRVTKVWSAGATFGSWYWDVETDKGRRKFAMRNPSKNVTWITDDRLLMRDTLGNRYEIESYVGLDTRSQAVLERVL